MMDFLREYLFIDVRRIKSYYEQITSSKEMLIAQKASSWEISAQLSSLGIKGSEAVAFRDPTILEMLSSVESFILKSKYFIDSIPKEILIDMEDTKEVARNQILFSKHTYIAAKAVVLPSKKYSVPGVGRLCLWLPSENKTRIDVFLIEACPHKDEDHVDLMTGCSALSVIMNEIDKEYKHYNIYSDIMTPKKTTADRFDEFASNPIQLMEQCDIPVGPPQKITTLFRLRSSFASRTPGGIWSHAIIGYPLYVAIT